MVQVTAQILDAGNGGRDAGLIFRDDYGDGNGAGVGEAEGDAAYAERGGDLCGAAAEMELGPLAWQAADFELAPAYATADTGPEGFGASFFGCETRCEALGGIFFALAVGDLAGGIDAFQKCVAEALYAALDAVDFDEVGAESDDQGRVSFV
jgi:hypothetical protein